MFNAVVMLFFPMFLQYMTLYYFSFLVLHSFLLLHSSVSLFFSFHSSSSHCFFHLPSSFMFSFPLFLCSSPLCPKSKESQRGGSRACFRLGLGQANPVESAVALRWRLCARSRLSDVRTVGVGRHPNHFSVFITTCSDDRCGVFPDDVHDRSHKQHGHHHGSYAGSSDSGSEYGNRPSSSHDACGNVRLLRLYASCSYSR